MTDAELSRAIDEDLWLEDWWRKSGQSKRVFIGANRADLILYMTDPVAFLATLP